MAGCYDFDRLATPRDDLAVPGPGIDLGITDGAPADLSIVIPRPDMACTPPPALIGTILRVGGAPGDGGYQTIAAAIQAAVASGGGAIFIAGGTYHETLTIHGAVTLYGGFDPAFACRDPVGTPTRIVGVTAEMPAVRMQSGSALDGLQIFGALGNAVNAVEADPGAVSVTGCLLQSGEDLTRQTTQARALVAAGVHDLKITGSILRSGAASETKDDFGTLGLVLCSSTATIVESVIEADHTGVAAATALFVNHDCNTPVGGDIYLERTQVLAHSGVNATGIRAAPSLGPMVVHLDGTAVAAVGPNWAVGIHWNGNQMKTLTLKEATVFADGGSGAGPSDGIFDENTPFALQLTDSIIRAPRPLDCDQSPNLVAMGNNLYFGDYAAAVLDADGGIQPVVLTVGATSYGVNTLAQFDPNGKFLDPQLTDGVHLGPGSPAIDHASACPFDHDLDGQPRPNGPKCDIGADEHY